MHWSRNLDINWFFFSLAFALIFGYEGFALNCPRQPDKIEEGRLCQQTCEYNGDCSGPGETCNCDDFCGMSCFNKSVNCEELPDLANGKLDWSSRSLSYAATVEFQCDVGYKLNGTETRICRSDQKWSGSMPTCSPILCPNPVEPRNGYIEPVKEKWLYLSEASHHCNSGFKFKRRRKRTPVKLFCDENGDWIGDVPECVSTTQQSNRIAYEVCNPPPILENGGIVPEVMAGDAAENAGSPSWLPDDVVNYYCSAGFMLIGTSKRRCKQDGTWTGTMPKCVVLSPPEEGFCRSPSDIESGWIQLFQGVEDSEISRDNGTDILPPESTVNIRWRTGVIIVYKCKRNFFLVGGSKKRTCLHDGTWTGNQPLCVLKSEESRLGEYEYCESPPDIKNGWISPDNNWGEDSYVEPEREAETMPQLAQIDVRWRENDVIVYRCLKSYSLVAGSKRRVCQSDGTWTGRQPRCVLLSPPPQGFCHTPPNILYGWFEVSAGIGEDSESTSANAMDMLPPGSTVEIRWRTGVTIVYKCRINFFLIAGTRERTCRQDGTWTGNQPICVAKSTQRLGDDEYCESPPEVENGWISPDRNWGEDMHVDPVGEDETLPPVAQIEIAWQTNDVIIYQCLKNHELVAGSKRRVCKADGTWTGRQPRCVLLSPPPTGFCHTPPNILYGWFEVSPGIGEDSESTSANGMGMLPPGSTVEIRWRTGVTIVYKCKINFFLIAGTRERTCRQDGTWTGNQPMCVAKSTQSRLGNDEYCESPPEVENGWVSPDRNWGEDSYVDPAGGDETLPPVAQIEIAWQTNDVIIYQCLKNHELVAGSKRRVCKADGTWTGKHPRCVPLMSSPTKTCPSPTFPQSGSIIPQQYIWFVGDQYSVSCNAGYKAPTPNLATCLSNGRWTPQYLGCSQIQQNTFCVPLPSIRNGWIESSNPEAYRYLVGESVTFRCNSGFQLIGGTATRTCSTQGTWTGSLPTCRAKRKRNVATCNSPIVTNGRVQPSNKFVWREGDSFSIVCRNGYQPPTPNSATCQSTGLWSPASLSCQPVSCPSPDIDNGFIIADGNYGQNTDEISASGVAALRLRVKWSPNDVITYKCNTGYVISGGNTRRVCSLDGTWTGSTPQCKVLAPVSCDPPPAIENGRIFLDRNRQTSAQSTVALSQEVHMNVAASLALQLRIKFLNNDVIVYKCKDGYELDGNERRVCSSGRWTGSQPLCKSSTPSYCNQPSAIENGMILVDRNRQIMGQPSNTQSQEVNMNAAGSLSQQIRIRFLENDVIVYKCKDGYDLVDGNERRVCTSGSWTGVQPQCKCSNCGSSQYCDAPPAIANGWIELKRNTGQVSSTDHFQGESGTNAIRIRYSINDVIIYKCRQGYRLVGGSESRTCYYEMWTGTQPTCQASSSDSGSKCGAWQRFGNGLYYTASTRKRPFEESYHFCRSIGGNLIDSSLALPSVISGVLRSGITRSGFSYWIGLKVVGQNQWMWSDNIRMPHSEVIGRFHYSDVLDRGQGRNCGLFIADPSKKWRVGHCRNDWNFAICQKARCDIPSSIISSRSGVDGTNIDSSGGSVEPTPNDDDPCHPNPCFNDCACEQLLFGYSCNNVEERLYLGKNCEYDPPTVVCGHDAIEVTIGGDVIMGMDEGLGNGVFYIDSDQQTAGNLSNIGEGCVFDTLDGDIYSLSIAFPFDSCGTRMEFVNDTLAFTNTIWFNRNLTSDPAISVQSSIAKISCSYQDVYKVTTEIDAVCCPTPPLITAHGVFKFQSSIWADPPGINGSTILFNGRERTRVRSADGVVSYKVGEMLYLTVEMSSENTVNVNRIFPTINTCWMSPGIGSQSPVQGVDLLLFPASHPQSVKTFGPLNTPAAVHFGFQLIQAKKNANVFLHCQIQVRHKRGKRSADDSNISLVTKGPIVFIDKEGPGDVQPDHSMGSAKDITSDKLLIGISVFGIFVLAMVITCCCAHLRHIHLHQSQDINANVENPKRKRNRRSSKTRLTSISTITSSH